jgi:iron complex transport system substrate-binding protein
MSTTRTRRGSAAIILLFALALAALAAVALVGCGSDASAGGEASPAASASSGAITVTDGTGTAVTMDQPATRIVSLAPANTEIAYAIGAGGKMVAGTSYDDYPEEAKSLPKIGDFANPNVEKIASFEPDLVLAAGGIQDKLRSKLEGLGMKVYVVDPKTYDGVMTDITNLGQLTGSTPQAQQVADTMQKAKDDVQAQVASASRPSTFLEIYSKPLMTAGGETFIDDMITLAGGHVQYRGAVQERPGCLHRGFRVDEQARRHHQARRVRRADGGQGRARIRDRRQHHRPTRPPFGPRAAGAAQDDPP